MTTSASLTTIAKEAAGCTRCGLYQHATQTVFGEGLLDAGIVLVGEQPGDQEDDELRLIQPRLVVLLGAVAGEAMFGTRYRVGAHKGEVVDAALGDWHGLVVGTIHPSAVLCGPDQAARDTAYAGLVADLVTAREAAVRWSR